mmetsp:Transcript_49843/g.131139  ORF Transcript_49843/g.131139 Transcript_49843/m.131139 type:complete len:650 (+) Transcript_49843:185-2134(+)
MMSINVIFFVQQALFALITAILIIVRPPAVVYRVTLGRQRRLCIQFIRKNTTKELSSSAHIQRRSKDRWRPLHSKREPPRESMFKAKPKLKSDVSVLTTAATAVINNNSQIDGWEKILNSTTEVAFFCAGLLNLAKAHIVSRGPVDVEQFKGSRMELRAHGVPQNVDYVHLCDKFSKFNDDDPDPCLDVRSSRLDDTPKIHGCACGVKSLTRDAVCSLRITDRLLDFCTKGIAPDKDEFWNGIYFRWENDTKEREIIAKPCRQLTSFVDGLKKDGFTRAQIAELIRRGIDDSIRHQICRDDRLRGVEVSAVHFNNIRGSRARKTEFPLCHHGIRVVFQTREGLESFIAVNGLLQINIGPGLLDRSTETAPVFLIQLEYRRAYDNASIIHAARGEALQSCVDATRALGGTHGAIITVPKIILKGGDADKVRVECDNAPKMDLLLAEKLGGKAAGVVRVVTVQNSSDGQLELWRGATFFFSNWQVGQDAYKQWRSAQGNAAIPLGGDCTAVLHGTLKLKKLDARHPPFPPPDAIPSEEILSTILMACDSGYRVVLPDLEITGKPFAFEASVDWEQSPIELLECRQLPRSDVDLRDLFIEDARRLTTNAISETITLLRSRGGAVSYDEDSNLFVFHCNGGEPALNPRGQSNE